MASDHHSRSSLPPDLRNAVERAAAELFVGRERELVQLGAALGEAIDGRGRLCLIAGEPGIGKTRLAERVAASAAERGANVIWGRCWEGEGAPAFWPWVQVIRTCLRQGDVGTLTGWLGLGGPYVAQVVPEVRELLPDLPVAPALDSEQARFRLYDAVCTFLRSAAAGTPLVVVLDDLHWADKSSLLLLQFLVQEIADARLLLLGTYRDVEVSRGHPLGDVLPRLRRERTVERILLRGLPEAEVHALLVALRGDEVPEDFARTISRETAGNPFFIMEILRHLLDQGVAHREGERWVGGVEVDAIHLPESVREVIGRRLARLGEACATLLTQASVVGQEFGLDVLQRVSDLGEERLLEALEEAIAAHVVDEVPRAIARYRFSHTLIRETLYSELRTLERLRRHRRVAEVLEALYARNAEPHLTELAHHFLEALPGGPVDKAIAYAVRAGDRANGQLAYTEAAILYDRALQALELQEPPDERQRCALLLKLGEARSNAGGFERPKEPLEDAVALAERLGDPDLFARGVLGLASADTSFGVQAYTSNRSALLERALAALEDRDSALRAQVMGRLATLRSFADPKGKEPLVRAAIEMGRRVGDARALASVLAATRTTTDGPDDVEERLARADELIRLAEEIRDERLAADGHSWKARHYFEFGDVAAAERETEIQERFAETSRQTFHRYLAAVNRAARALLEGRFEDGEELVRKALETADAGERANTPVGLMGYRTLLSELQGRAHEFLSAHLSLMEALPQVPVWRVIVAATRVAVGQTEAARRDLESLAADDFRDIPRDLLWLFIMCRLCDLVSFFGDARRAALLYDLLLPYADRCVTPSLPSCRGSTSRSLGILATLLSRYDEAERYFENALEMNARIRARIWVAHTQHDYARMLVARNRTGDRERAAALAAQALATAREVGMKPLEARVMELQAAAGFVDEARTAPVPEDQPTPAAPAAFQREGDFWTIAYEGTRIRLKDAKGLQYIAHLLRHDGQDFHAADLAAGANVVAPVPESARRDPDASAIVPGLGDAGEVLDPQARAAYRQRLHDLEAELAEATQWADAGRAARLGEEIEFLRDELSSAYGLGGRGRKAADVGDRARKAVTSRIRESIERIGKEHPALARHFENAIRTGTFCCYQPDRPLRWEM